MKAIYIAVLRKDKNDKRWWNAIVPGVWCAVTCGYGLRNTIHMIDLCLKRINEYAPRSFSKPYSMNEIRALFPHDRIIPFEIELNIDKYQCNPNFNKQVRLKYFYFDNKSYEILGSSMDYRLSRIFVLNEKKQRISEIINNDTKYRLLQIYRSTVVPVIID